MTGNNDFRQSLFNTRQTAAIWRDTRQAAHSPDCDTKTWVLIECSQIDYDPFIAGPLMVPNELREG